MNHSRTDEYNFIRRKPIVSCEVSDSFLDAIILTGRWLLLCWGLTSSLEHCVSMMSQPDGQSLYTPCWAPRVTESSFLRTSMRDHASLHGLLYCNKPHAEVIGFNCTMDLLLLK